MTKTKTNDVTTDDRNGFIVFLINNLQGNSNTNGTDKIWQNKCDMKVRRYCAWVKGVKDYM